jgi:PPE-repeat protein
VSDPAWPASPPEVNYLRLAGPGAAGTASTLASAAGWQALAAGGEIAASASTLNASATAPDFQGVGGLSSAAAAGRLNSTLHLLAGWVQAELTRDDELDHAAII